MYPRIRPPDSSEMVSIAVSVDCQSWLFVSFEEPVDVEPSLSFML